MGIINTTFEPAAKDCLKQANDRLNHIYGVVTCLRAYQLYFERLQFLDKKSREEGFQDSGLLDEYQQITTTPNVWLTDCRHDYHAKQFGQHYEGSLQHRLAGLQPSGPVREVDSAFVADHLQRLMMGVLRKLIGCDLERRMSPVKGHELQFVIDPGMVQGFLRAQNDLFAELREIRTLSAQFSFVRCYASYETSSGINEAEAALITIRMAPLSENRHVARAIEDWFYSVQITNRRVNDLIIGKVPALPHRRFRTREQLAAMCSGDSAVFSSFEEQSNSTASHLIADACTILNDARDKGYDFINKCKVSAHITDEIEGWREHGYALQQMTPSSALLSKFHVIRYDVTTRTGAKVPYWELKEMRPASHLIAWMANVLNYAALSADYAAGIYSQGTHREIAHQQISRLFCETHAKFIDAYSKLAVVPEGQSSTTLKTEVVDTNELIGRSSRILKEAAEIAEKLSPHSALHMELIGSLNALCAERDALLDQLEPFDVMIIGESCGGLWSTADYVKYADKAPACAFNFAPAMSVPVMEVTSHHPIDFFRPTGIAEPFPALAVTKVDVNQAVGESLTDLIREGNPNNGR